MKKPKILVTSASGHTGSVVAVNLLNKGFPVRAFVRRHDAQAERLRKEGAEIFIGDLFDLRDLRKALVGIQRAYYCEPFVENALHGSMLFALAAEEAKLEVAVVMSAWNAHSSHPAIHTREHWISDNIYKWLSNVDIVFVNPGLFAFTYFFGLPTVAHTGKLMLPYGEGLNAPPSNEDIASVIAALLAEPKEHIGKVYRPTGPKLISGYDIARVFGKILGRKVSYENIPTSLFVKSAKVLGFSNFEISHLRHYAQELRAGAYAVFAPTDHVELVTGRKSEDFEVTARRYIERPELVFPALEIGSKVGAVWQLLKIILTRAPDFDRWESERGYPRIKGSTLAHESEEWLHNAQHGGIALI